MANLMLTTDCNFNCEYCFGKEMIGKGHSRHTMTMSLFNEILDWFERAQMDNMDIHLMGGEPTLSPHLDDILEELGQRKIRYVIFSNFSAKLDRRVLEKSIKHDARWVVNANDPSNYTGNQLKRLHQHLEIAGRFAMLTLNITDSATKFDYILDYIDRFGLDRKVKIGVALPTLDHRNIYVKRDEYPAVAGHIIRLVDEADDRNIDVEFECGVAYCLFNDEQRKKLDGVQVSHCGSRLDITPTGNIINCLPLCSIASIPFHNFMDYGDALSWFQNALSHYRSIGSCAECLTCRHLAAGLCQACLADTLWKLNKIILPPFQDGKEKASSQQPEAIHRY